MSLRSLHVKSFQFAYILPAVKKMAATIIMTDTAMTAGAKVGGLSKLDVMPLGGVAAANWQRSIPKAARASNSDWILGIFYSMLDAE